MKYPINAEAMRIAYRQSKESKNLELNENDEIFIEALTNVINDAYQAGVRDASKQ